MNPFQKMTNNWSKQTVAASKLSRLVATKEKYYSGYIYRELDEQIEAAQAELDALKAEEKEIRKQMGLS